tara:strand:+ start:2630 stop:3586 length:957 start_codon:yes stop_codon:yes gene_type:complete
MKIMITGIAGMIGFHTAKKLLSEGHEVIGVDNLNEYYDVLLKEARLMILYKEYGFPKKSFYRADIQTLEWSSLLDEMDCVIHLAAYANPRHALEDPTPYINTNISGTMKLITGAERMGVPVVYASSSCVMHGQPLPWNETDKGAMQNNPYGWSKYVNECQFAHSKVKKSVGLRFFTVYGPYGRPDMALFKFTKGIVEGTPIDIYNNGDMIRDFTYVEDIVQGVVLVMNNLIENQEDGSHEIFNIGYGEKVKLMDFVDHIEKNLDRKADRNYMPFHPADTPATWSDTTKIQKLGYKPTTSIEEGVSKFVQWYKEYYEVN